MNQLTLPGLSGGPRFAAFCEFHRQNPEVFQLFKRFAEEALQSGGQAGARLVWERIRWLVNIEIRSEDKYKLNDHHVPYYARLLMLTDPRFQDFFERRDARFDTSDEDLLKELTPKENHA